MASNIEVDKVYTFSEALVLIKEGKKLKRIKWPAIYYVYIRPDFPDKFQFTIDRPFFIDEDLLSDDWVLVE